MKATTKMNPKQVEAKLQEARNNVGFVGDVEKLTIKNLIESAKANARFADKILLNIDPMYIHIPLWQRNLRLRQAEEIGKNYMAAKWELPKVYYHDGKLMTGEGQHRIFGAFLAGRKSVAMEFIDISEREAIDIFLLQCVDRTRMSPADMLKAAIKANKPEWVEFQQICHENGVNIKEDCDNVKDALGTFMPIYDGVNLAKNHPDTLDRILKLLRDLQWGEGCYNAKVIRSLRSLYAYYGDSKAAMEKVLINKCKGREFFKSKISPKCQYETFDFLSDIVNNTPEGKIKVKPLSKRALTRALKEAVGN